MQPFPFVDARRRAWHVYDYIVVGAGPSAKRCGLAIGDRKAEARAFVPAGRRGTIRVYTLHHGAWHGTETRTLEGQLYYSKPLDETAGEVARASVAATFPEKDRSSESLVMP